MRVPCFRGGTPEYEALGPETDSKELAVLQRPLASGRSLADFGKKGTMIHPSDLLKSVMCVMNSSNRC